MFRPWPTKPTFAIPVIIPFLITTVTFWAMLPSRVFTTLTFVKMSASGTGPGFDSAAKRVARHKQESRDALIPKPQEKTSQQRLSVRCRGVKQIQELQFLFCRKEGSLEGVSG